MNITVLDYLDCSYKKFPQKEAIRDLEKSLTYEELIMVAQKIGKAVIARVGADKAPIVVLMDKTADAFCCLWGILESGNIYVPLDPYAPAERMIKILKVINPVLIVYDNAGEKLIKELVTQKEISIPNHIGFSELCREKAEVDLTPVRRNMIDTDPAYIICTSGSTGIPKGVVISHRSIMDFTEEASEVMEFSEKEIFANQAPFYFDASVPDIYCTVRNGAELHILPQNLYSFPIKVLEYIKGHQVNAIFWVPSALIVAANLKALGEVDITCLKKIMFCGEVMPVKQLNQWRKYIPNAIFVNYYGPSETTYASTYYRIDREFETDEFLPIGRAAYNTGVLILDEDRKVSRGEIGELCIRGSGIALGYYNNPEKTAEVFVQNPLITNYRDIINRTGDLVRENVRGEIEYVGRKDSQIKHMGYRIELGEIENACMSIEGVKRVCCLYNNRKKAIILIYEGNCGKAEIRSKLKEIIPNYMMPTDICSVEHMPMNANNKVDRVLLKETYGE